MKSSLKNRARILAESLESRVLMSGTLESSNQHLPTSTCSCPVCLGFAGPSAAEFATTLMEASAGASGATSSIPVSSIAKYHSNPSAAAKLYIDFLGEPARAWGSYNTTATAAYTLDGDTSTFTVAEQDMIYQIWSAVAEKYAPFNLDVTTEDPGNRTANKTTSVVVDNGDGSWTGRLLGGISYINSFSSGYAVSTAYVFPGNMGDSAKNTAEVIAHEAGHSFGLRHQSTYSGTTLTSTYSTGTGTGVGSIAPIMGNSYSSERGIWWKGTSTSSTIIQDDLAILSGNSFGYRADDHGNLGTAGTAISLASNTLTGKGILTTISDSDTFNFTVSSGNLNFTIKSAAYGAMLDLKAALYTSAGVLLKSVDAASLTESLSASVTAGNYRLVISSSGSYGDVGQFSFSGTFSPTAAAVAVNAPTSLTAAVSGSTVNLAWADNATNETSYLVERSTDGTNFSTLVTLASNSKSYADTSTSAGVSYTYRVVAVSGSTYSSRSNTAAITRSPSTPSSLAATVISYSQINLSWTDTAGETGYTLHRSTDGTNFTTLATLGANSTSYSNTGLAASTKYYYRLYASNDGGTSVATATISATTAAIPKPGAATNLAATVNGSAIALTWNDNSTIESSYVIQRSVNGGSYSTLTTLGDNANSYTDSSTTPGSTYSYVVYAANSSGWSAASNIVSKTLVPAAPTLALTIVSTSQINIAWLDVSGETGYTLQRSTDGTNFTTIANLAAGTILYGNSSLAASTRYYYRLYANNAAGSSSPSAVTSGLTLGIAAPAAPTTLTGSLSGTSAILSWKDNSGVESNYIVERSVNGGSFASYATLGTNATSYTDSSTAAGSAYAYRVYAKNITGSSAATNTVTLTRSPATPTNFAATTVSNSQINLTWTDTTGETSYTIQRSTDGTNFSNFITLAAGTTSYTNTGLAASARYYYKLYAANAGGSSAASVSVSALTSAAPLPGAPTSLSATTSGASINVAWADNSSIETNYVLERSANGGAFATLATLAANSKAYTDSATTAGSTYSYRVYAKNAAGASARSNSASATRAPASPTLTATTASSSQINLTWTNPAGETGFTLQRSTDGTNFSTLVSLSANTTSYANTGLASKTKYFYRILASNPGGSSAYSTIASATTNAVVASVPAPAAPTNLSSIVTVGSSSATISLNWADKSNNESQFIIEYSTNGTNFTQLGTNAANDSSFTSKPLSLSSTYYFRVRAYNSTGYSAYTPAIKVVTPAGGWSSTGWGSI